MEIGSFYVVATPIGNLGDITLRAIETLRSVDYIACEDTRVTRKLLDKYQITVKLFDYQKFNEKECSEKIIKLLEQGSSIALVSDAGTPGISDPGKVLFEELRNKDINITPIPGSCAVSTFLSVLGREDETFVFLGFLPKSKIKQMELIGKYNHTNTIFYESPNRLLETLTNIRDEFGSDKKIAVGRELTKVYEEVKVDSVSEILDYYSNNVLKGELVVMLYSENKAVLDDSEFITEIKKLKKEGFSDKDISKILSTLFDVNKNKIYKMSLSL